MALRTYGVQLTAAYAKIMDNQAGRPNTVEFVNTSVENFYLYLGEIAPGDDNGSIQLGAGNSWYSQRPIDSDVWARAENTGVYVQVVTDGIMP